ncbi:MAG TPA: aspartyl protease family protein [Planctomycetaceae bacterium]|nr:aspartyl protease family protein [Planctomycetaceae bacterium]
MLQGRIVLKRIALVFATACMLTVSEPPRAIAEETSFSTKIERHGDVVLVPVTLGNKTYSFVLDTGASLTVFDNSLKPLLNKPLGEQLIGTLSLPSTIEKFESPSYRVGPFPATHKDPVVTTDLSRFRQITGHNIQGILGMSFLRDFVVQIDFDKGSVTLSRTLSDETDSKAVEIPLGQSRNGLHTIAGRIPAADQPLDVSFQVDTGASGVSLNVAQFRLLLDQKQLQIVGKTISSDLGSDRWDYKARLSSLSVDKFEHANLLVSHTFSPQQTSVMGLSYLSRFKVTFDFPNQKLLLEPGKQFRKRLEPNRSGIRLLRPEKETVVYSVDEGSPAQTAGVQPGDRIVKINDLGADTSTPFMLRNELDARPGSEIQLIFSRDGKSFKETLSIPLFEQIAGGQ